MEPARPVWPFRSPPNCSTVQATGCGWWNELAAYQHHLHVGSQFHLYAYSAAQLQRGGLTDASEIGPEVPDGPSFTVRVTAIVRFPQDVNAVLPLAAKRNVSYEVLDPHPLAGILALELVGESATPLPAKWWPLNRCDSS